MTHQLQDSARKRKRRSMNESIRSIYFKGGGKHLLNLDLVTWSLMKFTSALSNKCIEKEGNLIWTLKCKWASLSSFRLNVYSEIRNTRVEPWVKISYPAFTISNVGDWWWFFPRFLDLFSMDIKGALKYFLDFPNGFHDVTLSIFISRVNCTSEKETKNWWKENTSNHFIIYVQ